MNRNRSNKSRLGLGYRKVYGWLIKYIVLIFISALFGMCMIYMYCFYSQSSLEASMEEPDHFANFTVTKSHFDGKKYMHLDLKGAPPKVTYYSFLFPLLSKLGVSGVFVEYEDMFPFGGGVLRNVTALNAYSRDDIVTINNLAKSNGLEIVPLVNTISHLEFLLKLEDFKHLREVPENPKTICTSNREAKDLIAEMISQVVEAHEGISMIHIGADEEQYIGRCKQCVSKMKTRRISRDELFMEYIRDICNFIRNKYRKLSVLMWDDQLRFMTDDDTLRELNDLDVIPVVSQHDVDVFDKLGSSLWSQYGKFFPKVWASSAFKGAIGVDQYIVNMAHYLQNHRSWTNIFNNYEFLIRFEAVILSGRQRYDHFSTLCELLPVALPSLIMNLKLLEAKEENRLGPPKEVAKILKCKQPYALMGPTFGTPKCSYLGGEILENVYRLHQLKDDFEHLKEKQEVKGWMGFFNSYYNVSSPEQIFKISQQLNHYYEEVLEIEKDASKALLEVYDVFTKDEWITSFVLPLKKEITDLLGVKHRVLGRKVWPRKPFNERIHA